MTLLDNLIRDSHDPAIRGLTVALDFQTIPQINIIV